MVRDTDPGDAASPRVRLSVGAVIVVVLLALAATVAIALFRGLGASGEAVPLGEHGGGGGSGGAPSEGQVFGGDAGSPEDRASLIAPGEIYVHVFGAIHAPGLYRLGAGARVVDAVAAGGGFRDDAEPGAVNLARLLSDGEQLHVPTVAEAEAALQNGGGLSSAGGAGGAGGAAARSADGRINLNAASAADFETLPRVGPAMAQRIVAWRDANGRFTSVDDLLAVSGIGEKTLESLRSLVFV